MLARVIKAPRSLAGLLILLGMVLVAANVLGFNVSNSVAGTSYWLAAALLWNGLSQRNRRQASVLIGLGVSCLVASLWLGAELAVERLFSANVTIISMLVAVSFLSLVTRPAQQQQMPLPKGRRALSSTLVAIHAFGAVINLSAVFIIGDRLAQHAKLTREQSLVLVRGFSAAAFWSPFFAAMGVALSVAPRAELALLWGVSMPLAAIALGLTYWQLQRQAVPVRSTDDYPSAPVSEFIGYPLHISALLVPSLLAIAVLVFHKLLPQWSILAVITLLAPLFSVTGLVIKRESVRRNIVQLVSGRLAQMGNELILFLAAGVLAYGLESVLLSAHWQLPVAHFGILAAAVTYLAIIFLALLGVHPIVCIMLAASVWAPLNPDHSLMALVFLSSWALGTASGPLSGINVAFQGRYGVDSFAMMRWNLGYLALMSLGVLLAIGVLGWRLGINVL
ncbi:hypothetical protein [Oceanisphaera avium]|uniref:hypothetical protein n=1 Tax=Oceanisphaera avium TaxID=1903694 RepID=UPI001E3A37D0|nr:hypothetical protein [Oceanisphaera avium]